MVLGVEHDLFTSVFVNHQCSCSDFQSVILSASCWFYAPPIRYLNAFIMYIPIKHISSCIKTTYNGISPAPNPANMLTKCAVAFTKLLHPSSMLCHRNTKTNKYQSHPISAARKDKSRSQQFKSFIFYSILLQSIK